MTHTLEVGGKVYDVEFVAERGSKMLYRASNGMYFFEEEVTETEVTMCSEKTAQDFIDLCY